MVLADPADGRGFGHPESKWLLPKAFVCSAPQTRLRAPLAPTVLGRGALTGVDSQAKEDYDRLSRWQLALTGYVDA
jgi:hypothetical protein